MRLTHHLALVRRFTEFLYQFQILLRDRLLLANKLMADAAMLSHSPVARH